MISNDPLILLPRTEARKRMEEYASLFEELHLIVLGGRGASLQNAGNLFLHPVLGNPVARRIRAYRVGGSLCRRVRFDVVSTQSPDEIGFIGFCLSRKFKIQLQFQIHADIFSPWYRRGSWLDLLRYHMARFLIPQADCIRVVSERIRRSLLEPNTHNPKPSCITVLPIFTDISKFMTAVSNSNTEERFRDYELKMVAVGRFVEKEKNFSMVIEMMRDFVKICPRALLVLVGDGPDKRNYELRIRNYELGRNVILEPWRDDLPSFLKSFDLFLLSSNYEGWGRVVIEALAAGLPVVMTDVGLASEVLKNGENGIVVPIGDQGAFLSACKELYLDRDKRFRLARAAVDTIRRLEPRTLDEYLIRYRQSFTPHP